jgi:hypothetical protein
VFATGFSRLGRRYEADPADAYARHWLLEGDPGNDRHHDLQERLDATIRSPDGRDLAQLVAQQERLPAHLER